MRRLLPLSFGLAAVSAAVLATGQAVSAQEEGPPEALTPGSHLEVYLVTAGPGDAIWERFSHNAIRIVDRRFNTDIAYNWGIFDFRQESFIKRLAQGRMLYAMDGIDWGAMAGSYIAADRALYQHPIALTGPEKLELQRTLQAMDVDGLRDYRYDYYRDNCSTRVRDALDAVLGGVIVERWDAVPTETTYRWHTRRLTWPAAWAYFGIQFVVGNPGDEPLSAADEMFLPLKLMQYLEQTEIDRGDGPVPLLGERMDLHRSSRPDVRAAPPGMLIPALLLGLLVGGLLLGFGRSAEEGSVLGRTGLALVGGAWFLIFGLLGTGLMAAWLFTDHVFWTWNENVFSINPLGLIVVPLLVLAAMNGRWERLAGIARILAGLSVLGLVLQVLPGFDQVNGEIAALVLPANLALALATDRLSRLSRAT